MKTPMQELIDDLQDMCPDYYNNNYNWLHKLLEKEKELFVNTFIDGEVNCGRQLAQDYYNEKFNNNDN
jgi:hypothetical protein